MPDTFGRIKPVAVPALPWIPKPQPERPNQAKRPRARRS